MDEKEKTAFHEGGHCYRAWRYNFLGVVDTCMTEDPPGNWSGNTPIRRPTFTHEQRIDIALAGTLAEAKATASEGNEGRDVASSNALAAQIAGLFVAEVIPIAAPGVEIPDGAWQLQVPIAGADDVDANITRHDLAEIPGGSRDVASIEASLNRLVSFINAEDHWAGIDGIARALLMFHSGCLGHFHIYCIIRTATDPFYESE